jgi:hypothetical protein
MITVKFITDGTPMGSHVYCTETGEEIKNIRSVTIHAEAGKLPVMTLEILKMNINAVGAIEGYEVVDGNIVIEKVECVPLIEVNAKENELV